MSMVGLALRLSAVRALEHDNTIAEGRVFDSAILPIDQMISEQPKPFIVVSTETETGKPSGRDISNGDNEIDLLIEIAMSRVVPMPGKDENGEEVLVDVFETDANLELGLAVLKRQIFGVLFGRGGGAWGDVFRTFVSAISTITTLRGGNVKDGARFAGRQIVVSMKAIAEPAFGAVQSGTPWAQFIAALEADTTLAPIANVIKSAIENTPVGWPETYTAGAVLGGYTEAEAQAIGIAPAGGGEDVLLTEATTEPGGWIANAETIAEQLPEEP